MPVCAIQASVERDEVIGRRGKERKGKERGSRLDVLYLRWMHCIVLRCEKTRCWTLRYEIMPLSNPFDFSNTKNSLCI